MFISKHLKAVLVTSLLAASLGVAEQQRVKISGSKLEQGTAHYRIAVRAAKAAHQPQGDHPARPIAPASLIEPEREVFIGTGDHSAGSWVQP
jgi:hypothetical protein